MDVAASNTSMNDQLLMSSMHAEPAPPSTTQPTNSGSVVPASLTISPVDSAQVRTLDEIIAAKSDNDPRLDTELRSLSPAAKQLMRGRYQSTAQEKRNARGTIVFLLGRNISSADDVAFLHHVISEPPCRSLTSCENEDKGSVSPADRHHEGTNETTLAYPQLVALHSIEAYLKAPAGAPELSAQVLAELEGARRSPIRKVAALADELSRQYRAGHR
jgi:hypothetical protein